MPIALWRLEMGTGEDARTRCWSSQMGLREGPIINPFSAARLWATVETRAEDIMYLIPFVHFIQNFSSRFKFVCSQQCQLITTAQHINSSTPSQWQVEHS
jgi:hypothetical protein